MSLTKVIISFFWSERKGSLQTPCFLQQLLKPLISGGTMPGDKGERLCSYQFEGLINARLFPPTTTILLCARKMPTQMCQNSVGLRGKPYFNIKDDIKLSWLWLRDEIMAITWAYIDTQKRALGQLFIYLVGCYGCPSHSMALFFHN